VLVEASVFAPERLSSHPTNAFTFTFKPTRAPGAAAGGGREGHRRLRRVLPGDADDVMRLRAHFAEAALG
jgi:hypothetical protein